MTLTNPFQPPEVDQEEPEGASERPYTPAEGLDPEAPYGYTIDRKTGDRRPKKRAGRVRLAPKPDEADQPAESGAPKAEREPDRAPGKVHPQNKRRGRAPRAAKPPPEPMAPFRAGPIAKAVNRLYLRAGKLLRVWDEEIGAAVISMTRKELDEQGQPDPEDVTVGEAWEEVARLNPRIRALLMKLISGGAWSQLFMVHAPLLLAVLMKESVARRLPLMRLLGAFLDDSTDEVRPEPAPGGMPANLFAGLTQDDLMQAASAFQAFMPGPMPTGMNGFATHVGRTPETTRAATAEDFGLDDWPGHVTAAEHAAEDHDAAA